MRSREKRHDKHVNEAGWLHSFFFYNELRSRNEVQIRYFLAFLNQKIRYEFVIFENLKLKFDLKSAISSFWGQKGDK